MNHKLIRKYLGVIDNPSESILSNLESNSANQTEITEESRKELFDNANIILSKDSFFIKDNDDPDLWHIMEKYVNLFPTREYTIERIRSNNDDIKLNVYEYSLWKEEFAKHGIEISRSSTINKIGRKREIKDASAKDLMLSFKETPKSEIEEQFPLPVEQYAYEVRQTEETRSSLKVKRVIKIIRNENRSPPLDTYFNVIDENDAKTARIVALFLSPKNYLEPNSHAPDLSTSIYKINVIHLGDIFDNRKKPMKYVTRKITDDRVDFVGLKENENKVINNKVDVIESQGIESQVFSRLGIPLSGTTVIRLKPFGDTKFEGLGLCIVYIV